MGDEDAVTEFIRDVAMATQVAQRAGYDGERRESIHVAPLPRSDREPYGYPRWTLSIKQDNNGATYIVSRYPLNWHGQATEVSLI